MSAPTSSPELVAELVAINAEREAAFAVLREANAAGLTGESAQAVLDRYAAVFERVDAAKARWFGQARYRNHRLIVALDAAILVSPSGRSSVELWRAE